ncbi:MAG: two component transcriptional regulator, winged helix family [Thermoleophilia bacterium]|nr:two component transcriptional regulator, winged helix family [Thermoleophilia bacterium]
MGRAHVLVVDDDLEIRSMLRRTLLAEQYDVDTATNAEDGVRLATERRPDVIVMDIGLPDGDGIQAVERLRDAGRWAPVLMLTAHGDLERRVESFRAGADDFLAKPFHVEELLARLDALVRRGRGVVETARDPRLRRGDVLLDLEARRCWRGSREVELSPREFDLLEYLARNAGAALTRDQIVDEIWSGDVTEGSNLVDVYVGYLRRKLEAQGEPRIIRTVRGRGFLLAPGGSES